MTSYLSTTSIVLVAFLAFINLPGSALILRGIALFVIFGAIGATVTSRFEAGMPLFSQSEVVAAISDVKKDAVRGVAFVKSVLPPTWTTSFPGSQAGTSTTAALNGGSSTPYGR